MFTYNMQKLTFFPVNVHFRKYLANLLIRRKQLLRTTKKSIEDPAQGLTFICTVVWGLCFLNLLYYDYNQLPCGLHLICF